MWNIDLSGSVALVTGASRGIGRAIAVGLAGAGASVTGLARSGADLVALGEEIQDFRPVVADLADIDRLEDVADAAWEWRDGIDILVNAAGMMIRIDPPHVTRADYERLMAVNLTAPFFLCQAVGRRMVARKAGSIVNIASLAGEVVTGAPLMYQASKAALVHLTRGFAARFAPHVRVNAVGPGYVRTSLNTEWLEDPAHERWVVDQTRLGRVGTPEDVVGAVVFLSSPAASYVTGQHLRVDGGWG